MNTLETRKKWILPGSESQDEATVLAEQSSVSLKTAQLLLKRGVSDSDVESFLNPSLSQLPDAELLHGAKQASEQILKAIEAKKKIFIHGDFDADGISATAVLWEFLYYSLAEHLGTEVNCTPYIPDRVDEGYGLSEASIESMLSNGAQLIISVDCGIRDKAIIQKFKKSHKDLEFIITDHHQPPIDIAEDLDYTVVHPMFPGREFPYQTISGAAVAWLLVQNIRKAAKFEKNITPTIDGLDLVALSTVTDLMPLTGINRVLVHEGLEIMHKESRIGITKLAKLAGVESKNLDSYHLGFVIGPRINAAGRIGSPMEALKLLLTKDNVSALKRAAGLNAKNTERQMLTEEIFQKAKVMIENSDKENILNFIYGNEWPEGIVGLVAGKLVEEYGKPAIVVTVRGEEARGSARSFGALNITEELEGFASELSKYGGHAQAAGFSLDPANLEKFQKNFLAKLNEKYQSQQFVQELKVDLIIDQNELSEKLFNELQSLKPYGFGNPTPVVALQNLTIRNIVDMGKKGLHMKVEFEGDDGSCEYIAFNCSKDFDKLNIGNVIDIAGTVSQNVWNGNIKNQLIIKEWKKADATIH